jgi:mercuric ion transport protein
MNEQKLMRFGIAGTIVAIICCFTPILVIVFGAIGLSAYVAKLDFILLPALGFCIGILVYATWLRQKSKQKQPPEQASN